MSLGILSTSIFRNDVNDLKDLNAPKDPKDLEDLKFQKHFEDL